MGEFATLIFLEHVKRSCVIAVRVYDERYLLHLWRLTVSACRTHKSVLLVGGAWPSPGASLGLARFIILDETVLQSCFFS